MARNAPTPGLALAIPLFLASAGAVAGDELLSLSAEARIGEQTILGQKSPESFREYDLRVLLRTPWEAQSPSGPALGVRVLASAGVFEGPGKTAAAVSLVPLLALGTRDGRFGIDGGAGLAMLSEHRYGRQDFGGPVQAALTVGLAVPVYRRIGAVYRFMHYSDAGAWGPDTVGADLHMAGLSYRF